MFWAKYMPERKSSFSFGGPKETPKFESSTELVEHLKECEIRAGSFVVVMFDETVVYELNDRFDVQHVLF